MNWGSRVATVSVGLLGSIVVSLACSAPGGNGAPGSGAAQATNVRRTAVAEVQLVIANNPTATALPAATATPSPTCPNAIWWTEARAHIGEQRTIQGMVVGGRAAANSGILLEIGQPYPDPTGIGVLLADNNDAVGSFTGKNVCVAGAIVLAEGRPTLQVRDVTAVRVVDQP